MDDPHFDDGFEEGPTPIASPVGPEEWFVGIPPAKLAAYAGSYQVARGLYNAGIAAMFGAVAFVLKDAVARFGRPSAEGRPKPTPGMTPLA